MAYYLLVVVMGCNVQRLFFLVGGGIRGGYFIFDSNSGRIGCILCLIISIVLEKTTLRSEDLTRGGWFTYPGASGGVGINIEVFLNPTPLYSYPNTSFLL